MRFPDDGGLVVPSFPFLPCTYELNMALLFLQLSSVC